MVIYNQSEFIQVNYMKLKWIKSVFRSELKFKIPEMGKVFVNESGFNICEF